jgi:WD40 repeat protein
LLTQPGNRAASAAFSPDGVTLAVGELGLIRFYDLSDVQMRAEELQGVGKNANALAFSPDAGLLAAGAGEPMLRLWTRGADKRPDPVMLGGFKEQVLHVAFSFDGRCVAASNQDSTARVWERDKAQAWKQRAGLDWSGGPLAFAPYGPTLATSENNAVRLWNLPETGLTPAGLIRVSSHVTALGFAPDGRRLFTGSLAGSICTVDLLPTPQDARDFGESGATVFALAVTPNGRTLLSVCVARNKTLVFLWDANSGKKLGEIALPPNGLNMPSLGVAPDGRHVAVTCRLGVAILRLAPTPGASRPRIEP